MRDILVSAAVIWAHFGGIVFVLVVVYLALDLPGRVLGSGSRPVLAVKRTGVSLVSIAVVMSVMMVLSQWMLSRNFVDALSVSEMFRGPFLGTLGGFLLLALPIIVIRVIQLDRRGRRKVEPSE